MAYGTRQEALGSRSEGRRLRLLVPAVVVAAIGMLVAPGATLASSDKKPADLTCTTMFGADFSPGLTFLEEESGRMSGSGTLNCTGTFKGEPIAGPGSFSFKGRYSGICESLTARLHFHFELPEADGGTARFSGRGTTTSTLTTERTTGEVAGNVPFVETSNLVPDEQQDELLICTPAEPLTHAEFAGVGRIGGF